MEAIASIPSISPEVKKYPPSRETVQRAAVEMGYYIDCAIAEHLAESKEKGSGADSTSTFYDRSIMAIAFWGTLSNEKKWEGPAGILDMVEPGAEGVLNAMLRQIDKYVAQRALRCQETKLHEFTQVCNSFFCF